MPDLIYDVTICEQTFNNPSILIVNPLTQVIIIIYFGSLTQALPPVAMLWTVNAIKVLWRIKILPDRRMFCILQCFADIRESMKHKVLTCSMQGVDNEIPLWKIQERISIIIFPANVWWDK